MSPFSVGQLLLGLGPSLECCGFTHLHTNEEKWFFLSQQVSITNRFLLRAEALCPHPLSLLVVLTGFNLCKSVYAVTDTVSLYVNYSSCVWKMLFP